MAGTNRVQRLLARHRRNPGVARAGSVIGALHRGFRNLDYDPHTNGEARALRTVARTAELAVLFDVGANTGLWTRLAAETCPSARIHAFEIVPDTYRALADACAGLANVTLNDFGLGERDGEIPVYFSPEHRGVATCLPGFSEEFHGYRPQTATARIRAGDAYCREQAIPRIDYLKLDVEGYEPDVLRGCRELLAAARVPVIQFEYGYVNIRSRFLLKDYHELLVPLGMRIGKIYPTYVDFREYRYQDEDFLGPNYLAVHASQAEVIRALAR
jgi:FkbM family methyltransferase